MPIFVPPCPGCYNESPIHRKYNPIKVGGATAETWQCLKCNIKWNRDDIDSKILWNLVRIQETLDKLVEAPQTTKKGK